MYQHNRPITYYSVLGAYAYDDTLFDNFSLHEEITSIDKSALIDYIIYENADMPLHVVNLDLLKIKIGLWCKKNSENWLRIYEALYQKYNPLHNFDRYEETEDTSTGEGERNTTSTGNGTNTETVNLEHVGDKTDTFNTSDAVSYGKTETRTDNLSENTSKNFGETETHTGTETNAHENTAFNAGVSLTARDTITKNLTDTLDHNESGTKSNTGTQTNASGGTDTTRKTGTIKTDDDFTEETRTTGNTTNTETGNETYTDDKTLTHGGHLWGNIGVTTSQKMLQDEIDVRFNNNFYDIISAQFRLEFCVLIY